MFPANERILLATDGSADAGAAARAATDLARRMEAALHVVHVRDDSLTWRDLLPTAPSYEQEARATLDRAVRRIEDGGGTVAGAHARVGRPADEILALGDELGAGLIVLGRRGLGLVQRLVLGSVAEAVVTGATCPTLVVREGAEGWPVARVVAGDDGSATAGLAATYAARIAALAGVPLILARAHPRLARPGQAGPTPDGGDTDAVLRQLEEALAGRAHELAAVLGQRPEHRLLDGDPTFGILELAERGGQPTLIVVGSRALSDAEQVQLGSTSSNLLKAACGPILIYPHPAAAILRREGRGRRRGRVRSYAPAGASIPG